MRLPMSSRFDEYKTKIDSYYSLKSLEAPCHNSLNIILLVHIQPICLVKSWFPWRWLYGSQGGEAEAQSTPEGEIAH